MFSGLRVQVGSNHRAPLWISGAVGVLACVLLYCGWRLHWFLTDDAFIAFRYIDHRRRGFGYTWNPPPFLPVEGYTSFAWVVILDGVWSVLGIPPPQAANVLSLWCAYGTLALTAWATWRVCRLHEVAAAFPWCLACVLLATVSHRSFLVWASGGLETALFNLCLQGFVLHGLLGRCDTPASAERYLLGLSGLSTLAALTRPEGLLPAATSGAIALLFVGLGNLAWSRALLALSPLAAVMTHLLWRVRFYGELLPNTYYAKVVASWPEAGLRYLGSFVLEYGYYLAMPLWLYGLWQLGRRVVSRLKAYAAGSGEPDAASARHGLAQSLARAGVLACVLSKLEFDVFIAGGDHFEYRALSYLVPLLALAFLHGLLSARLRPALVYACFVGFIAVSSWLPWSLYTRTRDFHRWPPNPPVERLASDAPWPLQPVAAALDELQGWLIPHGVGVRHAAHRGFWLNQLEYTPSRDEGARQCAQSDHPLAAAGTIGVIGWVLPGCYVLDILGLNDYVVARTPLPEGQERYMAHDRSVPPGYLERLMPNVSIKGHALTIYPRPTPLT
ncbi:MAG: hypothetical protein ABW321_32065, partial [Polyangiales bacterium]